LVTRKDVSNALKALINDLRVHATNQIGNRAFYALVQPGDEPQYKNVKDQHSVGGVMNYLNTLEIYLAQ
jgi:hypothetical protein